MPGSISAKTAKAHGSGSGVCRSSSNPRGVWIAPGRGPPAGARPAGTVRRERAGAGCGGRVGSFVARGTLASAGGTGGGAPTGTGQGGTAGGGGGRAPARGAGRGV